MKIIHKIDTFLYEFGLYYVKEYVIAINLRNKQMASQIDMNI